jgi:methionine synthase II (cobalamin-independent)
MPSIRPLRSGRVLPGTPGGVSDLPDDGAVPAVEAPEEPLRPEERATGIGSLPGVDHHEAARTVVGELPAFPHVAELPDRGVGADMVGRAAALLVDLAVEVWPSGYRVSSRPGAQHRRGVDLLARDVDALDSTIGETGAAPRRVKTQVAGPWTLCAGVELRSGNRALTDRGAVAEFTESLAEGLRGHVAELARRTGADVVVQIDEPTLPAVLAGTLSTPSGYGTVRSVSGADARAGLAVLVDAARDAGAAAVVAHCCHPTPPLALLGATGVDGLAVDLSALDRSGAVRDAVGEQWDAGRELWLGLVPSRSEGPAPELGALARPALDLADRLGFDRARLADRAVVTPTCGLAGATPAWARTAMARTVELAEAFADPPSSW